MDKKLALFDFCETLVSIQSADAYIDYVRNKKGGSLKMFFLEILRKILVKTKFFSVLNRIYKNNLFHKKIKLRQLKGIQESVLNKLAKSYYYEKLKPMIIKEVINEFEKYIKMDIQKPSEYNVFIVSGGYSIYIKHFALDFGLDATRVIATDIAFGEKGLCKGKIEGLDCMKETKIIRLKQRIKDINTCDLKNSLAFSDSITDLPLLLFVGKGVVISKQAQYWATQNQLKELIWE